MVDVNKKLIIGFVFVLALLAGVLGYFSHSLFPGIDKEIFNVVRTVGLVCSVVGLVYSAWWNSRGKQ